MVGAEGFEPPTLCSQSRCATRLRYAPTLFDCSADWLLPAGSCLLRERGKRFARSGHEPGSSDSMLQSRGYMAASSSVAERLTVAQDVVGSIPTSRPNFSRTAQG